LREGERKKLGVGGLGGGGKGNKKDWGK